MAPEAEFSIEAWDPLHNASDKRFHWTTTNIGEAVPGLQTPLSMDVWLRGSSHAFLLGLRSMGVLKDDESLPAPVLESFYGRGALSIQFLQTIGERMPGADPRQTIGGLVGEVPDGLGLRSTRAYYGRVLTRFPYTFVTGPRRLRAATADQHRWWREEVHGAQPVDEAAERARVARAIARHRNGSEIHSVATFAAVQPVHDALERVVAALDVPGGSRLTSPIGGAEMQVIADIWEASRGRISVSDVVSRHGFHGPDEGELSSRVWRDDAAPLARLVEQYSERPDDAAPGLMETERLRARSAAERDLLAAAPAASRVPLRGLLALARRRLHLRGVGKRAMLEGFDGVRASARRLGHLYAADGRLSDPDDIFFLTAAEVVASPVPDLPDLVARRRERREAYAGYTLPASWSGVPVPVPVVGATTEERERNRLVGLGVSAGVVEGRVRVVTDPGFTDVEPDEILVAPFTDPSWASIMFISSALVVDIGGALSHAAVVARELEIPCVVRTHDGTKVLQTGDLIRVDGDRGVVEVLQRKQ